MTVALRRLPDGVRIGVTDNGSVPAAAVVARPSFPNSLEPDAPLRIEDEATTGRGLAIVSMLATAWGVDTTSDSKEIWCDLQREAHDHFVTGPTVTDDDQTSTTASSLPPGWAVVRLAGCPVELSMRQDEHLDELIRELQLMRTASTTSQALAEHLQELLSEPAHARHTGRRTAQLAWQSGAKLIDVEMAMPREFGPRVLALHEAVNRADVLCEQMQMLTVASPPELRALRRWMAHEVSHQLGHDAAPVSWTDWVAGHPVGVAERDRLESAAVKPPAPRGCA
jgi:hypothetical protein